MDGGYIFCGWENYWEPPEASSADYYTRYGWLVKLDSSGQTDWHVLHTAGTSSTFFSARQLPQGGYIVAGQIWDEVHSDWNGYLLRYAPETGIEDGGSPVPGLTLQASTNPFTSSVTIACEGDSIPSQLMVYDITGRLVRSLSDREGSTFLWDGRDASGTAVPTGTYLIQGAIDGQVSSIRVVKL
jgi:hypothetical protein